MIIFKKVQLGNLKRQVVRVPVDADGLIFSDAKNDATCR